jgi:hypothetical protein
MQHFSGLMLHFMKSLCVRAYICMYVHCESKKGPLYFCPYLSQILTAFQNFLNVELNVQQSNYYI